MRLKHYKNEYIELYNVLTININFFQIIYEIDILLQDIKL